MKVVLCPVFWENNVKKMVLYHVLVADCGLEMPFESTMG